MRFEASWYRWLATALTESARAPITMLMSFVMDVLAEPEAFVVSKDA